MSDEVALRRAERHLVRYGATWSPFVAERAAGAFVEDAAGRRVLDFTSGQMSAILGHSHPEIVAVVTEMIGRLDHLFSGMLSRPGDRPRRDPRRAGARAVEGAAADDGRRVQRGGAEAGQGRHRRLGGRRVRPELARHDRRRQRGDVLGRTPRPRSGAGRVDGGVRAERLSAALRHRRRPARLARRARRRLRPGRPPEHRRRWRRSSPSRCCRRAASSTSRPATSPPLQARCRERGMLLVLDEAQTGIGRTGTMLACERDGVVPDILTLSKTLGAGLPLAAVLTTDELEEQAHERGLPLLHDPRLRPAAGSGRRQGPRDRGPRPPRRAGRGGRRPAARRARRAGRSARLHRRRARPGPARRGGDRRRPRLEEAGSRARRGDHAALLRARPVDEHHRAAPGWAACSASPRRSRSPTPSSTSASRSSTRRSPTSAAERRAPLAERPGRTAHHHFPDQVGRAPTSCWTTCATSPSGWSSLTLVRMIAVAIRPWR